MKVQLKQLKPNPFRNLPHYPIDKDKIAKLKSSIKRTGFWDNLVARKAADGDVEIAYGHHRRQALLDMYPGTHEVNVIVRELGDGDMIKVMADENDEVYNLTPAVINETVLAARDYLRVPSPERHKEVLELMRLRGSPGTLKERDIIAEFLDWDVSRVKEALAELSDIEQKVVEKEVIDRMPSQKAAEAFRKEIKKREVLGEPVSRDVQRTVARSIKTGETGTKHIAAKIIEESYPTKPDQREVKKFEAFVEALAKKVSAAATGMYDLAKYREAFDSDIYRKGFERFKLASECERFTEGMRLVFGKETKHGKGSSSGIKLLA